MRRYTDQVVVVTGAGRGLGRAMVDRFAAEGATVALVDRDEETLAAAQAELSAVGHASATYAADVASSAAMRATVEAVADRFGRIDALVNNAGIIRDNRIENITDEDWQAVIDVSLGGAFNATRAVLPHMRDRGYGRIVSFSSMSWRGNFGQANYVAAKAGVVGFTRGVALEVARQGITVNAIAPGLLETPMLASMNDAAREKLTAKVPARHTGDPTDIAAAAAFLCSPEARYITGVVLDVDGGIGIGSSIR